MKLLRLFPLELGRLLHSRMTWLIVLLTVISPAVGLVLYKPAIASTMLSMYLANPWPEGRRAVFSSACSQYMSWTGPAAAVWRCSPMRLFLL